MEQPLQTSVLQTATTARRFMNLVVDTILCEIVEFILIYLLVRLILGNSLFTNFWIRFMFALLIQFFYYFIFETAFQRTPGKFITGTRVMMADGSKPDISTIAKRTIVRFTPFEVISMYTGKAIENKGTWWHDRWVSTRVVRNTTHPQTQIIDSPQLVTSSPEKRTISYGLRAACYVWYCNSRMYNNN
ncbi:MAG: RDD family protein [Anaerolineales bacterium]